MATKRSTYTPEFKDEAVRLVLDEGMTRAQVARDLGVHESLIGRWVQRAEKTRSPEALEASEREELRRLRKENRILRKERAILKKAAAFFAKENP